MASIELEPTGERMILEHYQDSEQAELIRLFHTVTYRFAEPFTAGKDVLDYGCGSGYGSHMIAASARSVEAVDVASDAISYARARYSSPNLQFGVIRPDEPLPFADASFDSVVSCQVVEHVADPNAYLHEIERVLRPGGTLVLATPDRRTRLLPLQRPWNRWHVTEYSESSLVRLLAPHFVAIDIFTMGGERSVIDIELRRTRRLKWSMIPFTLPLIPDAVRVGIIVKMGRLKHRLLPTKRAKARNGTAPRECDISIGKGLWPSVNLIAVAHRRQASDTR